MHMYNAIVITVSDRCYKGEREDLAGPAVKSLLESNGYKVSELILVPDEELLIKQALTECVNNEYSLIITTGGTGFSKRDITPECTKAIIERETPGISEYMRYKSSEITNRAVLSRGVSGIKNKSLIVNLPGSPKAATENLGFVINALEHGLKMLLSKSSDCANE